MPNIIDKSNFSSLDITGMQDLGYTYPMKMDLRPSSQLHQSIVTKTMTRARDAESGMSPRYPKWDEIHKVLNNFINTDDSDDKPTNVPISYLTMDTILSHWFQTFSDGPLLPYEGVGPEDNEAAMLAELLIDYQLRRSKAMLNVHTMFRDAIVCGFGVIHPKWQVETGMIRRMEEETIYSDLLGQMIPTGAQKEIREKGIIHEGNCFENVEPRTYYPDPNVAIQEIQKGEFVSWIEHTNYASLLETEKNSPEAWFNVRYLKGKSNAQSNLYSGTGRYSVSETKGNTTKTGSTFPVDLLHMYIRLIPKDWKVGRNEYPEKWIITIAGDGLVVRCHPIALGHSMFPIAVCSPTYDGYSSAPISLLEIIHELVKEIDWLKSAHKHNVKNALYNRVIVDPYLVNYKSVVDNKPGGAITIREHAWGRGVENAVKQLTVTDVTHNHMNDVNLNADMIQRISGAVDSLQGFARSSGERRSATEMRDTRLSALGRVEKQVRLASIQALEDLGRMCLGHTREFMTKPTYVKVAGRRIQDLRLIYGTESHVLVDPRMFMNDGDIIPVDGARPGGEYIQEKIQMLGIINQDPVVASAFDRIKIILDMYMSTGITNATSYLNPDYISMMEQARAMAEQQAAKPTSSGAAPIPKQPMLNGGPAPQ